MNILHPHGMVERLGERQQRLRSLPRYGRTKDGSPKDAETWTIADKNDRRKQPRNGVDPLRGRLVDFDA